ncbi:SMP-30/gluconolactonase/LRE family protein [Parablastomonas sp. CN1-191]|uniref:SMP-30/gluconolactonase/LRE family protein n=1 Tax=Parablastomonas sp. CN1-191 TaxID=3400908 RepID=UPI003BF8E068
MTSSSLCLEPCGQVAVGNRLGEGIVWDCVAGAFVWTDIHERRLFRLSWPGRELEEFALPHRLGSFALTSQPACILAAFEQGFAWYDLESTRCDWIARPQLPPGVRFNDGRVDRAGRFVAGTMVEDPVAAGSRRAGALFRLEETGVTTRLLDGIGITNALCWSPDGGTMYHADSTVGVLNAYEYGAPPMPRRAITAVAAPAVPDGATVDAKGRIWVALWGGAAVGIHSAEGAMLETIDVPVSQPTCVALGGPDMDILAVTSAHDGLTRADREREPGAGNVFFYATTANGLPECRVAA